MSKGNVCHLRNVDTDRCHPTQPFRCPASTTVCISIQYLCDGAPDCPDGYDEDPRLCTAEGETLEDFGKALHLMRSDLEHLRSVFMAVESGDISLLRSLGIRDSELADVKFFLDKLVATGFMD
ncbi:hypothetical protein HPB50_016312 [Hyalomma asiaticum]|uniref:Uncharacterized protein n=1 Tax=Hyalomma asiaticum TaxID=266040 RepID=A0ACB7RR75_HYAAI|nr:hypothetical protein HPB50_016312 [Hyalomma asiaticum]